MLTKKVLILAPLLALIPSVASALPPKIWTAWQDTSLNNEQCLSRAENAVRSIGFSQNIQILESGIYSESGDYSVTVRCGSSRKFVFFITAGPSSDTASNLLTLMMNKF